jgi:ubiquinone/menaquinone biosynthesis C-methylase UbiE
MDKNIEDVKKYWNSRPCNIRHSNKEIGTREYFDEVETRKYFVEPHIPEFADFPRWRGKKVLEIGCGIGTDTVNFSKNGALLTSVDLSEESLEVTRKRLQIYGLEADLRYADAENLSEFIEPQEFDLVYSFGVLHHTPNPETAFEQVKKFMGPHSEFRMMVYNRGAFKVFQILEDYHFQYEIAEELIAKHSEAQSGCPVTYSYTPSQIKNILESRGFEVTSVEIDHIFPYKVEKYVKYIYEREEIWNMPDETFREFEKRYGWHLMIKAKLKS